MLQLRTFKLLFGFLISLALSALLSGCEFKDIEIKKVSAMDITSLKGGQLEGLVEMELVNPNNFNVKVKEAHFNIFMGNVKVGEAQLAEAFKIENSVSETYPIKIKASIENILAGGITGLLNAVSGQPALITLKGEIKAGAYFVTKSIPVEFKSEVPLRDLF